MRTILLPTVLLVAVACGRMIEVRTSGGPGAVGFAPLLGQWSGQWTSDRASDSGLLTIDVQEFDGQPVVNVQLSNPCFVPGSYEIVTDGRVFELVRDGVSVLRAELSQPEALVGSYTCSVDAGAWSAARRGDLPAIVDLGGSWLGSVATGLGAQPMVLELDQEVVGGEILLAGTFALPGLLPEALAVVGSARFHNGRFDLSLGTEPGTSPRVVLGSVGDSESRRIDNGLLQVAPDPRVPFASALWQALWTGE
jgi:hypothetical protein